MPELVKLQHLSARRIIAADNATSVSGTFSFFDNAHSGTGEYNDLPDGMLKDAASGFITGIGFQWATPMHTTAQTAVEAVKRMGTLIDLTLEAMVVASVSGVEFFRAPLTYCPSPNVWVAGQVLETVNDAVCHVGPNGWRPTFGRHQFAERSRIRVDVVFPRSVTIRDLNITAGLILQSTLSLQTTQPLA